jgi:hypothetical protein
LAFRLQNSTPEAVNDMRKHTRTMVLSAWITASSFLAGTGLYAADRNTTVERRDSNGNVVYTYQPNDEYTNKKLGRKRTIQRVGGSAAGGAAVGALAGGGKGAAIGALVGGGGGYVWDKHEKNKQKKRDEGR